MNKLAELDGLKHLPPAEFDAELAKRLEAMKPKREAKPKAKPAPKVFKTEKK